MTLCCAENCPNRSASGVCFPKILKKIPKNAELRAKWIYQINRPNYKFGANSYVCEFHFAPDQWENRDAWQLKKDAIPTLFCFCSKNRLPFTLCENLIHDHRYSSSPFLSQRMFSRATARTDEKENQKYTNLRKRGRPFKGSRVDHEQTCPMKLRVIDHDYTMLLPVHNARQEEFIPAMYRNKTIELATSKNGDTLQESSTLKNTCDNLLAGESTLFPSESCFLKSLFNTASTNFSFSGKHSFSPIKISYSTSDLKKNNQSNRIGNNVNKLKNEVMKLKKQKAVLAAQLSKLRKEYARFIKHLSGKSGEDQLTALIRARKAKGLKWSNEKILRSLRHYNASTTSRYESSPEVQSAISPLHKFLQRQFRHIFDRSP
ncbi:uncharacterized protein LOC143349444 [Colletes latitarsis]|uniref:uncharacterized protein LOC143349444 n=1 Tax=Colletes latitarsis TaxID=2605962 RepID=UPI004036C3D1